MAGETNNEILKAMADSVDPAGATTEREFNNDLLKRIAGGIDGIVKPSTGKVDATKIDGVIPAVNLPSFVDDVVEGYLSQGAFYADQAHQTQIEPETGKIYVDLSADTSYRWGGSAYTAIGRTLDAASQAEAEAGQDNAKYMTALRTKQAIDYLTPTYSDVVASTSGQGGSHGLMTASDKEKLDGIAAGAGTNDLGITGASVGQFVKVSSVDSSGKPTSWAVESLKHTLTITCVTQDNVIVTGQTVTVRELGPTGPVIATLAYEGQPVSVSLPVETVWHASVSDTLAHHFNPSTETGVILDADVSATLIYSDFTSIRTAADIQAALDQDIDLTELVGEQITCSYGTGTLAWDVADYDSTVPEVTLLAADCSATSANVPFENAQALAYFEDGLAAGDYSFQNGNTTYYLTLTKAIPSGGQLRATSSAFTSYESQDAVAALENGTVSTTAIENATLLGKCGTDTGLHPLNHMDRVTYGSNNYGESGIRQWLNSSAEANAQMPRMSKFSRPYAINYPGFLGNLDPEFVACVADTAWKCSSITSYECPSSMGGISTKGTPYTVTDKFALASQKEVAGSYDGVEAGDGILDLFVGAQNADRIRRRGTSTQYWWLRSPDPGYARNVRYVYTSGGMNYYTAYYSYAAVPACKISKSQ